jgi:hypothetical protein
VKKLLDKITPQGVRFIFWVYKQNKLKNTIIKYLKSLPTNDGTDKQREILVYLQHNRISFFPYNFIKEYNPRNVIVYTDENNYMNYVLYDNKRLYFKKQNDAETCRKILESNGFDIEFSKGYVIYI